MTFDSGSAGYSRVARRFAVQRLLAQLAGLVAIAACGAASGAMPELNHFTIENRTGSEIEHVFVSAGDSENFGADVLSPAAPLGDGQEISLAVHYPERCEVFNILALAWGIDLLRGRGEILRGQSARLRLLGPAEKLAYGVRAVDENGRTYSFAIDVGGSDEESTYEILDDWIDAQGD